MNTERITTSSNGLPSYRTEPVRLHQINVDEPMTFAHVLNVHNSEELWLADAIELFLSEYFAKRQFAGVEDYRRRGAVPDHMRDELFRQSCVPGQVTLESMWLSKLMLDCYERDGSFADDLYGEVLVGSSPNQYFCDDGDDECEYDCLSSELLLTELLTEVCITPDSVSSSNLDSTSSPQRPVRAISLIEQED